MGIEAFKLDRTASNTMQSHRLVQWAARHHGLEYSEALYDLLNVRHFVEGRKLNDRAMLLDAAAEVGIGQHHLIHPNLIFHRHSVVFERIQSRNVNSP